MHVAVADNTEHLVLNIMLPEDFQSSHPSGKCTSSVSPEPAAVMEPLRSVKAYSHIETGLAEEPPPLLIQQCRIGLDAIAAELDLHDLSEAVEYCILKQKLDEKELAHALLARLSAGALRPVDDENENS